MSDSRAVVPCLLRIRIAYCAQNQRLLGMIPVCPIPRAGGMRIAGVLDEWSEKWSDSLSIGPW